MERALETFWASIDTPGIPGKSIKDEQTPSSLLSSENIGTALHPSSACGISKISV
jgi:hypothetical protein